MTGQPDTRNESASTADRSPPGATAATPSPPTGESVRRSLRALANGDACHSNGTATACPTGDAVGPTSRNEEVNSTESEHTVTTVSDSADAVRVIETAERAVASVCDAAALLAGNRLDELDEAIAIAARDGERDVADRGRAARKTLRRLNAALDGSASTREPDRTAVDPDIDTRPTS